METTVTVTMGAWSVAEFPSSVNRQEFLDQVRLWNEVEGLPMIEALVLSGGMRLRFRSSDHRLVNIVRLVEAFGGFVGDRAPSTL